MQNAWRVFRHLTDKAQTEAREQAWFELIKSVAPDLDQIDFTADHWQQVINNIINNNQL